MTADLDKYYELLRDSHTELDKANDHVAEIYARQRPLIIEAYRAGLEFSVISRTIGRSPRYALNGIERNDKPTPKLGMFEPFDVVYPPQLQPEDDSDATNVTRPRRRRDTRKTYRKD